MKMEKSKALIISRISKDVKAEEVVYYSEQDQACFIRPISARNKDWLDEYLSIYMLRT
jgi:hypothetical protein